MSRRAVIWALVAVGVAVAVAIGAFGSKNSQSDQQASASAALCTSLDGLESSVQALTGFDPTTMSKDDFSNDVSAVKSSWNDVTDAAGNAGSTTMNSLTDAYEQWQSRVQNLPSSNTVQQNYQEIEGATRQLGTSVQSTLKSLNCSSGSA
jgi:hypothetical protein